MIFVIILACFVTGALVYPTLPAQLVSHWNAAGQPNGHLGKFWVVFLLPLIMLGMGALWAFLPNVDPIAKGYKGFRYVYDFIWFLIVAFLAYVYALMLGANLGWTFDMLKAIYVALGFLIAIIGSLLPYIRRNWFMGIRTPWSLSSDAVWEKTHRLAGQLFRTAGLLIFAAAFVSSHTVALWLVAAPLAVAVLVPVVYSYLVYRKEAVH